MSGKWTMILWLSCSFVWAQTTEPFDFYGSEKEEAQLAPILSQEYTEARKNALWCPTTQLWHEKNIELGPKEANRMTCPPEGPCDDPAVRDATPTTAKTIHVILHIMRASDGSGGISPSTARATVGQLIADYAGTGITFKVEKAYFHNDDTYNCIPQFSFTNPAWQIAIDNMKLTYGERPTHNVNIFFSCQDPSPVGTLLGIGTFPWDPDADQFTGGLWVNNLAAGAGSHTISHEMGHCLGLWHTHHGVSEVPACSACYEFASGFEADYRGDFCSDTPATPLNNTCSDPSGSDCQGTPWGVTQPENYMSYAPDSCQNLFTKQQTHRMHCWVSDELPLWFY